MRYLNGDLNQPSTLSTRLWEARRGILTGLVMAAFWSFLVLVPLVVWEGVKHAGQTPKGAAGLFFLLRSTWFLRDWGFVAIVACYAAFQCWMQELAVVSEGTQTFEQIVARRLKALEQRVWWAESVRLAEQRESELGYPVPNCPTAAELRRAAEIVNEIQTGYTLRTPAQLSAYKQELAEISDNWIDPESDPIGVHLRPALERVIGRSPHKI